MNKNNSLLHLATRANQLASQLNAESELQRLAARLARDPDDLDALAGSVVYEAKSGGILAEFLKTETGLVLLHVAIARVSYACWEELWNQAHPDRFGQGSDGEDFELMAVWRERVCTIIDECHQKWMLEIDDADEYTRKLQQAGASKEAAEGLADWLGNVRGGADESD